MTHPVYCERYYLGKFYTDSIVHDTDALQLLTKVIGKDKIIMGYVGTWDMQMHCFKWRYETNVVAQAHKL